MFVMIIEDEGLFVMLLVFIFREERDDDGFWCSALSWYMYISECALSVPRVR